MGIFSSSSKMEDAHEDDAKDGYIFLNVWSLQREMK